MSGLIFQTSIAELVLDVENPRFENTAASQADALGKIINLNDSHFRNLAKSISDHGLDPGDAFYVYLEGDKYVVLDGNRRLATLKVMQNLLLLKGCPISEPLRKKLIKEMGGYSLPKDFSVNCVEFNSRSDAADWIERRHGNGLEGEGRIKWGPKQIQHFRKDRSILDLIDFVESRNSKSHSWLDIKLAAEKNTSTIRRLVDSGPGRNALGYDISKDEKRPTTSKDPDYVAAVLLRIFSDIKDKKINSRSHNKSSEINKYYLSLPEALKQQGRKEHEPLHFHEYATQPHARPKAAVTKSASVAGAKISRVRRTLCPSRIHFNEPDFEKGKQLFREASKLRVEVFPLSAAFCFRAILEFTVDVYMSKHRLHKLSNQTLGERVNATLDHLVTYRPQLKDDLKAMRSTLSRQHGPMSTAALNGYIHNKVQLPTADDLRTAWDHCDPFFRAVFGAVK